MYGIVRGRRRRYGILKGEINCMAMVFLYFSGAMFRLLLRLLLCVGDTPPFERVMFAYFT